MTTARDSASSRRGPAAWPWHPFLLAATIVVSLWLATAVSPWVVFRPLAWAVGLAAVLVLGGAAVSRSWQVGGLVASGVIGLLWSKELIGEIGGFVERMGALSILWLGLIGVVVLLGVRLVLRRRAAITVEVLTTAMNRAALLLLVATLVLGVLSGRAAAALRDLSQGASLEQWAVEDAGAGERVSGTPDIFVILLDGYPRADALDHAFGFDNSEFLGELEARGFDVADASHSDYLWTHLTLPSMLNMAYVEQIPGMLDVNEGRAPRQPTLRWTVADNAVFEAARSEGYTAVAVGAGFEEIAPRQADVYVDGGQLNEFEIGLLNSTFVADLVAIAAPDFASSAHRSRIESNLAVLPRIAAAANREPVLVFAHVPAPHQPTVFGADGSPVAVPLGRDFFLDSPIERGEDPDAFRAAYRGQLEHLNRLVREAVDGILASASEPPVIILVADHGSASSVDWNATTPDEAEPAQLLERTATLFAALTPARDGVFPDDISPVDVFRLLFDAYWGTSYGRAEAPADGGQIAPVDASVFGE